MNTDNSEIKLSDFDKLNQCRYTDDFLERIFPEIIDWPTPLMAKCVDQSTFILVSSGHEIEVQDEFTDQDYSKVNARGLGNLAYISLYHSNKETGRKAHKLIGKIRANQNALKFLKNSKKFLTSLEIFNPNIKNKEKAELESNPNSQSASN